MTLAPAGSPERVAVPGRDVLGGVHSDRATPVGGEGVAVYPPPLQADRLHDLLGAVRQLRPHHRTEVHEIRHREQLKDRERHHEQDEERNQDLDEGEAPLPLPVTRLPAHRGPSHRTYFRDDAFHSGKTWTSYSTFGDRLPSTMFTCVTPSVCVVVTGWGPVTGPGSSGRASTLRVADQRSRPDRRPRPVGVGVRVDGADVVRYDVRCGRPLRRRREVELPVPRGRVERERHRDLRALVDRLGVRRLQEIANLAHRRLQPRPLPGAVQRHGGGGGDQAEDRDDHQRLDQRDARFTRGGSASHAHLGVMSSNRRATVPISCSYRRCIVR